MKPVAKIWMNGELIPWDDAQVHVLTHALHYGFGVFEGIRAYETEDGSSAVFRLPEHVRRLCESAHILMLQNPYTPEQWISACEEVVRVNGLRSAYVRPVLFVGYGELDWRRSTTRPSPRWRPSSGAPTSAKRVSGTASVAKVSSFARSHVNSHMLKGKINGMYVNNILAKREAVDDGYDEAIMLDTAGYVAEASGENLFIIREGKVFAPPLGNVLAGITRYSVIDILRDMGHEVVERNITRDELYIADEIFMCGTAAEVTPVRSVDYRQVGAGKPGPITLEVQDTYLKAVRGGVPRYESWLHRV